MRIIQIFLFICFITFSFISCSAKKDDSGLSELYEMLNDENISSKTRYGIVNRIANILHLDEKYNEMILFLTDWVETHPDDEYNSYWLYMVAIDYQKQNADKIAEYYFERILSFYPDLLVGGQSIHLSCLEHLIQISTDEQNRISYFKTLINNFPSSVSITEMYVRLALEYEKEGEWEEAFKAYKLFLEQPDSSTIQIPGIHDAYQHARRNVDFAKSPKDWTFESLRELEGAVKKAIAAYDWRSLDKYRTKVNFFAMSWKSNETDANAQESFSMRNYMRGNRIRFNPNLDESSNANEAYLRTTGWNTYINVWYFYFRKINFPSDPEIHGRWEWAGIYFGEKM
ncbi:MAG: tetratricopeptide repeat protein [Treponema sp.]|nr:tetratricopeptide repeat protein [Treponema sp.]